MLLGSNQGGVVDVTNSFGVFHVKREGEVLVRRTAVNDLLALHKRINDKEVVVGWCVRGGGGDGTVRRSLLTVVNRVYPFPLHAFLPTLPAFPVL